LAFNQKEFTPKQDYFTNDFFGIPKGFYKNWNANQ